MNKEMKKNSDKAQTIINVHTMKEIQWNFEGATWNNSVQQTVKQWSENIKKLK